MKSTEPLDERDFGSILPEPFFMASVRGRRGTGPGGAGRRGMDPVRKTDDAVCPRIAEKRGMTLGVKAAENARAPINVGENARNND